MWAKGGRPSSETVSRCIRRTLVLLAVDDLELSVIDVVWSWRTLVEFVGELGLEELPHPAIDMICRGFVARLAEIDVRVENPDVAFWAIRTVDREADRPDARVAIERFECFSDRTLDDFDFLTLEELHQFGECNGDSTEYDHCEADGRKFRDVRTGTDARI